MLLYNLRLAWLSLRRTPLLSSMTVLGIALGIGVAITFIAIRHMFVSDPVPSMSAGLHYVRVDAWDPLKPFPGTEGSGAPPRAATYRDAKAIVASDIPTRATLTFPARPTVFPENEDAQPYKARTRCVTGDFFPMMDLPLRFGEGWDDETDAAKETVVVLDDETNQRLFGGEDSVGRRLRIEDREFTVVGVLAPWKPFLRYWDVINSPLGDVEQLYIPFDVAIDMQLDNAGNDYGWGSGNGNTWEDYLASESAWVGVWAQLDSDDQRARFTAFLDAYALDQKELGRFQRPLNNRATPLLELLDEFEVLPAQVQAMTILSFLFLLLCIVNVVGLLMGKFLARAPEVGARRALGASRATIFLQHVVECELVGVLGGALGLGFGWVLLQWINAMPIQLAFTLDGEMLGTALILSVVAGFAAGLIPSWRISSLQPAAFLKQS